MMQNLKRNWLVVSKLACVIWRLLTWAFGSLKNLHFNGLLLTEVYNVWSKKVQRSYLSWHWRMMLNLKKNGLIVSKITRIWWILTWTLKILNISTMIGCFCATFNLKKYRGFIFHGTEEWSKIWRKTDLWFRKWHEEFGKFSLEHSQVSKLKLWWDSFIQRRKCMPLKSK